MNNTGIEIATPLLCEFEHIKHSIRELELDGRNLVREEFLAARCHQKLVGFGRMKAYASCQELCSLGVIQAERLKGIGSQLTRELIKTSTSDVYVVCIIPEFFKTLGFYMVDDYPDELQDKLRYCTNALSVPETYVVMKYKK